MAIDMTPEQREVGRENYRRAVEGLGLNRREFMKGVAATAGAVAGVGAAAYFGYQSVNGHPVKTALIGGGDEGGVLVGEHSPDFMQFVAVCDIRPSNMKRIFDGDPAAIALRKGFRKIYGNDANHIKRYDDYKAMLRENKDVEAVVIAVPLHLHAPIAIDVMKIGQERGKPIHVLCEKLMAWNVSQCKQMIHTAKETGSILSIGHQRHYSMLYAHASDVIHSGVLGEIRHIRALWHRNNTWDFVNDPKKGELVKDVVQPRYRDGWFNPIYTEDYDALKDRVQQYGYKSVEELIRWRLYTETGGGLMAELGSHQLDACSIFLGKKHPLAVTGVGGKYFYGPNRNDRDAEDHVFVTYEFPGPNYPADKSDLVIVTYSSISTNQFENYGECVMGTHGTMVVEREANVMLYTEKDPNKNQAGEPKSMAVTVTTTAGGKAALESSSTWGPGGGGGPTAAGGPALPAGAGGPVSRGYREEMEDFAYCVRLWDAKNGYAKKDGKYEQRLPRCHGEVAMADAIIALTANLAMKRRERIEFKPEWFEGDKANEVPDGDTKPRVPVA
jgi:predicted dehydrogenase